MDSILSETILDMRGMLHLGFERHSYEAASYSDVKEFLLRLGTSSLLEAIQ